MDLNYATKASRKVQKNPVLSKASGSETALEVSCNVKENRIIIFSINLCIILWKRHKVLAKRWFQMSCVCLTASVSLPVKQNNVYSTSASQGYHVNKSYVYKVLCVSQVFQCTFYICKLYRIISLIINSFD